MMRCLLVALPILGLAQPAVPAPEFAIELDMPPRERFKQVAHYFQDDFYNVMKAWRELLKEYVPEEERTEWVKNCNIRQDFQEEIRGFVEELNDTRVTYDEVLLWNLMYELGLPTVYNSGVLAVDNDGRVLHARNYDMQFNYKARRTHKVVTDVAVNLTFSHRGQLLYWAPSVAGYFGLHTVMKYAGRNHWSFQQNTHYANRRDVNLQALKNGAKPYAFFMRQLVEQDLPFRDTMLKLQSTAFAAPCYFLMAGGNWEGAAMEIRPNVNDTLSNLAHVQVLSPQIGRWYLIQTNTRVWDEEDQSQRRPKTVEMLLRLGGMANVTADNMMRILRTKPMFNDHTMASMVMIPSLGESQALLRPEPSDDLSFFFKPTKSKTFLF